MVVLQRWKSHVTSHTVFSEPPTISYVLFSLPYETAGTAPTFTHGIMLSFMLGRILPALLLSSLARAAVDQSSVGPLTSLSSKSTVCSVLDYGGVADGKTDIGPAILSAFTECASKGAATLYIPPGNYSSTCD